MSGPADKKTLLAALIAAVLGLGSAGLAACGDENELIFDSGRAEALKSNLDEAAANVTGQDCNAAEAAVLRARKQVSQLSGNASDDVIAALDDKLVEIQATAERECQEAIDTATEAETSSTGEETTSSEEETTSSETTPTETTPTQTTETTPTEATTPSIPVPPTLPVNPPGGGGTEAPAGDGER